MNFVFDVDGTLTPSRGTIDSEFKQWFLEWIKDKKVYLATGSDYPKTLEQLGPEICNSVTRVYNCAGNAVYEQGQLIRQSDFKITEEHRKLFEGLIDLSEFNIRTGNHIEERIGLCNVSVIGRNCTKKQREEYVVWDKATNERKEFASIINKRFPELEATAGGETGLDVYERGKDKSQIAKELDNIVFFGDAIFEGGNDYSLAQKSDKYHRVYDWQNTFRLLRTKYNDTIQGRV